LQTVGIDLVEIMAGVDDLLKSLKGLRSPEAFSKLFAVATNIGDLLNVTISKPRIPSKRSMYRA